MEWQPIATAPKDGTHILLHKADGAITVGRYDDDKHASRPRPYWHTERGYLFGRRDDRDCSPTHWMPIPEPPK